MDDPGGTKTVNDMMEQKGRDMAEHPAEYGSLRSNMRKSGQTRPITVAPHPATGEPALYQGHHRYAIGQKLGWEGMDWHSDMMKTDDDTFNNKTHLHGDFFQ